MTFTDVLADIARLCVLAFVLTSMLGLGLSLTFRQIVAPLRNVRLVLTALLTSFVVAPLVAWGIGALLGLDDPLRIALMLLGVAAGAPFLPKLAQLAKADVPYAVGLMILLMVVSVGFVPLALSLPAFGVEVSARDIAKPLVFLMLLPLLLALLVRARYPEAAEAAAPLNRISSTSLVLGLVAGLAAGFSDFVGLFGTRIVLASLLLAGVLIVVGYVVGGSTRDQRVVSGLGGAQRNLSAALLVAGTSFADTPEVLLASLLGALVLTIALLATAAEFGKRAPSDAGAPVPE